MRDAPLPSWDLLRRLLDNRQHSVAWRDDGRWAIDTLESTLGIDWPSRAAEADPGLFRPMLWGASHVVAYAELLEFALRLQLLQSVAGMARLRRSMRADLRAEQHYHTRLQLEVASLAIATGCSASFERKSKPGSKPVDVEITTAVGVVGVETKVVLLDLLARQAMQDDEKLMARIGVLQFHHDVVFDGGLPQLESDGEVDRFVARVEAAAIVASRSQTVATIDWTGVSIQVLPNSLSGGSRLDGPSRESEGWPRLAGKLSTACEQMAASGASWLRIDAHDGCGN